MMGKAKHWSLVSSSGCPTARSGHCATAIRSSLYVFGGCGHPVNSGGEGAGLGRDDDGGLPVCLGDLHIFDVARQRWSEAVPPNAPAGSHEPRPAERTCAAMCASDGDEQDRLFLSGGAGDDPYDLRGCCWEFCIRRRTWRVLYDGESTAASPASEISPCRRIGHTMVHDAARNRLVIFGGSTGLEYFDDTQVFDLATRTWSLLATAGERPSPRYKHQAFVDSNFMYVVGGGSFEPEGPDLDVYRLPLTAPAGSGGGAKAALEWERVRPTGVPPRCRAAHGLAWDPVGRAAYIWGGFTSGMELDSTFCALRLPPSPAPARPPVPPPEKTAAAAVSAALALPRPDGVSLGVSRPTATATAAAATAAASAPPVEVAAAAAAALVSDDFRDLGGNLSAAVGVRDTVRGRARALSADAAVVTASAATARDDKPLPSANGGVRGVGLRRRASASGTELAEQQQWQHERWQQHHEQDPQHQEERHHHHQQEQPQEQPQQEREQPPPLPGGGVDGRERWRRRGQRLWRHGSSSTERSGNTNDSSRNSGDNNSGGSSSSARRSRGSRRRPWAQGWATGRLQGLWGGSGGETGERDNNNLVAAPANLAVAAPHAPPVPFPPPSDSAASPPAVAVSTGTGPLTDGRSTAAAAASAAAAAAAADAACQELSWVMLPSSAQGGGSNSATRNGAGGGGGEAADAAAPETPSSPAGRSFHCAFFHGGACYVTGGSDGARKFGDMWRFRTRETPPPLATLAARAFLRSTAGTTSASRGNDGRSGGGGRGDGIGGGGGGLSHTDPLLLQSLPEEVREALRKLNMQAEVVF